jgi:Fe-S-cluster containining protein
MKDFICTMCGECCQGEGSAFLYPDDVKRMSKELNMPIQEFVDKYTSYILFEVIEGNGSYLYVPYLTLKKNEKDLCVFSDDKVCTIHKFKPFHCDHTPFVSEFFSDEEWHKEVLEKCPALMNMKEEDFDQYKYKAEEADQNEREYYYILRENSFNLEKILNITLPAPQIIISEDSD